MNILLDLFLTFAKIGLFTFGGGYAMISMIENNCVERKQWITHDEMMNVTVIAESTPGPIAINCATFTGYKKAGFIGALVATLGIVVPSFIVIYLISMFLDNFLELTVIAKVLTPEQSEVQKKPEPKHSPSEQIKFYQEQEKQKQEQKTPQHKKQNMEL